VLLGLFIFYQFGAFKGKTGNSLESAKRIGIYFIFNAIANAAWIFSWQYKIIPLSLVLMIIILITLIMTYLRISKGELTFKEKVFVRLPFSVYFGWITVATVANVTTLLVSLGWNGFGISQDIWTIVALLAGLVIGGAATLKNRDIAYGLVIIWAYSGILMKHLSSDGFAGKYGNVIMTVIVSLIIALALLVVVGVLNRKLKTKVS